MLRKPAMQDLSAPLAHAARTFAEVLARAGQRGWIVGGTPRDLALGREVHDLDMASAATPEHVESLGLRTFPAGRAFGTVGVLAGEITIQHTTFRSERGYTDARRPDVVQFGATLAEDASRRDFTCNALYLDPLTDEFEDPEGGLADLARGVLRCVGEARARFEEDGLRLVRLARFAAALELAPAPDVLAAARDARDALRGVSPERVLAELETLFARPRSTRALALLAECDLLTRALPGAGEVWLGATSAEWWAPRARVHAALETAQAAVELAPAGAPIRPPGLALGLAALFGPAPGHGGAFGPRARALAVVDALRVARATRTAVAEIWELALAFDALAALPASRAQRVRWMRANEFANALALAHAWRTALARETDTLLELARERAELGERGLAPAPLVDVNALAASAIPRGPWWGKLLHEAETLQLDGAWRDADEARAWLARRAAELAASGAAAPGAPRQDGGKSLRKPKDRG